MTQELSFLPIVIATYDDDDRLVKLEADWAGSFNEDDDRITDEIAENDLPWTEQVDFVVRSEELYVLWERRE